MIEIKQMIIPYNRKNRPATQSWRQWYKYKMEPLHITIHNPFWSKGAKELAEYQLTDSCANRPASWHLSIDDKEAWQSLPFDEPGFHAGDNLGTGNGKTIGIEVCDRAMLYYSNGWKYYPPDHPNMDLYRLSEEHAAKICSHLIKTIPSLKPFPDTMKQHYDWSKKNCPYLMRARKNGWQDFLYRIEYYLQLGEVKMKHRVIVGSFTNYENAVTRQKELQLKSPTLFPFIVYNKAGEKLLFRVVAAEHDREDHAKVLADSLKKKGMDCFIISATKFEDLNYDPDPVPDYDPPDDPEEHEEPAGIPAGLMEILKNLYEWLKNFFGGKEE